MVLLSDVGDKGGNDTAGGRAAGLSSRARLRTEETWPQRDQVVWLSVCIASAAPANQTSDYQPSGLVILPIESGSCAGTLTSEPFSSRRATLTVNVALATGLSLGIADHDRPGGSSQ